MAAVCGLVAVPICEASWHAIVVEPDAMTRGLIGLAVGLPVGLAGLSFHWWKNKAPAFRDWAIPEVKRWWPAAILLAFVYVAGPEIYRRATLPVAVQADSSSENVSKATAAIQSKLDAANRQLQEEHERAKPLMPLGGAISGLQATKEAKDVRSQMDEVIRQNEALRRELALIPSSDAEGDSGPIKWGPVLWFPASSSSGIRFIMLRGENSSNSSVQFKSASFTSALTGEKRDLSISIPYGNLDGEKISVGDTNPIPAGAKIQLVSEWTPPISVQEFMNRWGKISLAMDYDGTEYRKSFDTEFMKASLLRDVVGADLVLGVPRVTKKESTK